MKGIIISPDCEFYTVKDIDDFINKLSGITLKEFIEDQEFSLDLHDTLESMVREGKIEKGGAGADEDRCFEELRKTLGYLRKKLESSVHKEKIEGE